MTVPGTPSTVETTSLRQDLAVVEMSEPLPPIKLMTDSNRLTSSWWVVSPRSIPPEFEIEQGGKARVVNGEDLPAKLVRDLKLPDGKGFRRGNLVYRRHIGLNGPISQTPSDLLSRNHDTLQIAEGRSRVEPS